MPYSDSFYHHETRTGKQYQRRASGKPYIPRLAHGHSDYWISPSTPKVDTPKKLILADWSAANWSISKIQSVQVAIKKLIKDRFDVYMWQDGVLKPLKADDLSCLENIEIRSAMMPPDQLDDFTYAAATQYRIEQDKIHVLDDYWVDYLINLEKPVESATDSSEFAIDYSESATDSSDFFDDFDRLAVERHQKPKPRNVNIHDLELKPRSVNIHDLVSLEQKKQYKVLELLSKAKPKLSLILYNDHSEAASDMYDRVESVFQVYDNIRKEEYLLISDDNRPPTNKEHIKELILEDTYPEYVTEIASIFRESPLETLVVKNNTTMHRLLRSDRLPPLVHLKQLIFSELGGKPPISELLSITPNLECLHSSGSDYNLREHFTNIAPGGLPHLKEVYFHNFPYLKGEELLKLSLIAPHIKKFELEESMLVNITPESIPENSLPSFEEFTFSGMPEVRTVLNIQCLLNAMPNIKSLSIPFCKVLIGDIYKQLPSLEKVNFSGSDISSIVPNFLTIARNIKSLDISGTIGISQIVFEVAPGSLPALEELHCIRSDVTADDISKLINGAPNIRVLDLRENPGLAGVIADAVPGSLSHLQEAHLNNTEVNQKDVRRLLQDAKNLKKIDLSNCKTIDSSFSHLEEGSLPSLLEINLSGSSATATDIQKLLKAAPNLKKINIAGCKIMADIFSSIEAKNLSQIEELDVSDTEITNLDLKYLLKTVSRIKKLVLGGEKTDTQGIFTDTNLEFLEHMEAKNINLTPMDVNTLLLTTRRLNLLRLDNCGNLSQAFDSCEPLFFLEELSLKNSMITEKDAMHLLEIAPNLKNKDFNHLLGVAPNLKKVTPLNPLSSSEAETTSASSYPQPRSQPDTSQSLDADTSFNPDMPPMKVNRVFYPMGGEPAPEPNNYRLNVFQVAETNQDRCKLNQAFKIKKEGDLRLRDPEPAIKYSPIDTYEPQGAAAAASSSSCYYGKQTLRLDDKWQALASLSPDETILQYHIHPSTSVIIQKSDRDNLYYIRSTTNQAITVDIDFVISVPEPNPLPKDIEDLITPFKDYGKEALKLSGNPDSYTGEDYLKAILVQKLGACRHRALAFKCMMDREYPKIPVRIISNDCHMFVEIQTPSLKWHLCNLGGYPAALDINASNKPNKTDFDPEIIHTVIDAESARPKLSQKSASVETEVFQESAPVTIDEVKESSPDVKPVSSYMMYRNALATWVQNTSLTHSSVEYYQQCFRPVTHDGTDSPVKNRLIHCASTEDVDALHYALQAHGRHNHRPVFYVNSPDDLLCPVSNMHCYADGTGELLRERNSPFYQFLTDQTNADGVVVVNYSNFKPDDFVRFNSLLDPKRSTDGAVIPENMLIIGLLNDDSQHPAPGRDMTSRFDEIEVCPLNYEQLTASIPRLYDETPPEVGVGTMAINLYNSPDWEERLLGRWIPHNGGWLYEKGILVEAMAKIPAPTTLDIQNGLWEDKEFCRFWREARQTGTITYPGGVIHIAPEIKLLRHDDLNLDALKVQFQKELNPPSVPALILNSATFADFFGQYDVINQQLNQLPGYIEKAAEQGHCLVHVTRSLPDNEWAMLLDECKTRGVVLHAYCEPNVELPELLQSAIVDQAVPNPPRQHFPLPIIIESTDADTTVRQLKKDHPNTVVIDVSECDDSDLLWRMSGEMIDIPDRPLRFNFTKTKGAVLDALEKGQNVILTGRVSSALADQLAPLLLSPPATGKLGSVDNSDSDVPRLVRGIQMELSLSNRSSYCSSSLDSADKPRNVGGQVMNCQHALILVSNDTSALTYLPRTDHVVTVAEKCAVLTEIFGAIPQAIGYEHLSQEPLSILEARCRFIKRNPDMSSDDAWLGLNHLPDAINDPGELSEENAQQSAAEFHQGRLDAVHKVLADEPYVFLTGLSGVGKTTFVADTMCKKEGAKLYREEADLLNWATDVTPNQRKYLFFDEANLSTSDWSAFEGLFNHPPSIVINGESHELTADHKVIFSGNPVSYGDERKLAPFFERHGNAVVFNPLPSSVLYTNVLLPVFKGTPIADKAPEMSAYILKIYRYLCLCSKTDVLISPRELQMMALLTLSHCSPQDNYADIEAALHHFTHELAKPLVPKEKLAEFHQLFPPVILQKKAQSEQADYLITPSRGPANALLEEFLSLQEMRREPVMNSAQAYGGLGGFILEGEPGVGKSEMVINTLVSRGYQKQNFLHPTDTDKKSFYHMAVSMAHDDKVTLLLQAFHKGAVVLIDEINSSPMMEQLINALLMGKTPAGEVPDSPGFMIIGTQNPITMAGRRSASTAMARRTTTVQLPSYTMEETRAILMSKGLSIETTNEMVSAYETQKNYAKAHHLTPEPTFRDLMKLTKCVSLERMQHNEQKAECKESSPVRPTSLLGERKTALEKDLQACAHYIELIRKTAWPVDSKTHDWCNQIERSIKTPGVVDSFVKVRHRLELLKAGYAALTSKDMMLIYDRVDTLGKNASKMFSTGNLKKASNIKRAVCDIDLMDRGNILSNKENKACQVVCEALGKEFQGDDHSLNVNSMRR